MKIIFGLKIKFPDSTEFKEIMNEVYALEIKELRRHGTWRHVAAEFADMHPSLSIIAGNQIEGMHLCKSAAAFLGENEDSEDWN